MSILDLPSTPTRVGLKSNGMLLTPAEYDAINQWDDRYRYELVHGVLIVVPPAGPGERGPNDELGFMICRFQEDNTNGHLIDDTLPEQEIRIGQNRRRMDRAIWVGLKRQPNLDVDVPTIAVEFVSASNRDRKRDYSEKRTEYAQAGVEEYWVIDRFRREMTVFRRSGEVTVISEGESYEPPLIPGFVLSLDRLLERADRYRSAH